MDRFDPFVKYSDIYGDVINWEKDPMNKPHNQNKYFFSDGKTYYEQICKMLKLMSVFKDAFNQIYDNEDEISSAWENFVGNLSATAISGEEAGVELTWTDTSVNFAFTIPGGEDGVGISSITFNSDYTMTITLTNGQTYTSTSLRGPQGEPGVQGEQGPQGEPGAGLEILDVYPTIQDLQTAHPTGEPGDAYQVGTAPNFTLYIWSASQSQWVPAGTLGSVSPSLSAPLMDGTASPGSSDLYSRGDHIHPTDTSRASKEELDALIKTSQSLIDQSFTYRESPAIQDGLATIEKIKGNTLAFNQLVQNGNFADMTGWLLSDSIPSSVSNGILTATIGTTHHSSIRLTKTNLSMISGKKYLFMCDIKPTKNINVRLQYPGVATDISTQTMTANVWGRYSSFAIMTSNNALTLYYNTDNNLTEGDTVQFRNCVLFDLSLMGLDNLTSVSDFTDLFPLPYYDYNTGSLLSFNGTGIKTIGKNLLEKPFIYNNNSFTYADGFRILKGNYVFSFGDIVGATSWRFDVKMWDLNGVEITDNALSPDSTLSYNNNYKGYLTRVNVTAKNIPLNIMQDCYIRICFALGDTSSSMASTGDQLEFGSTTTDYEPYKTNTLPVPISTYFPTGMKSAGTIYDELTPTKATTRIGAVDLGSLSWTYDSSALGTRFYAELVGAKKPTTSEISNILCANYKTVSSDVFYNQTIIDDACTLSTGGYLSIRDTTYNDATAFTTAMSGVYLFYELTTPTEQDIDIDLTSPVWNGGTEQLLPINTATPTTSPILCDMTYMSISDEILYLYNNTGTSPDIEDLENDVANIKTQIGSETTTPMTGLAGRVKTNEDNISSINTTIGSESTAPKTGILGRVNALESDVSSIETEIGSDATTPMSGLAGRIKTIENALNNLKGKVVYEYTSTSTDQRLTTAQLDMSDLNNATHIEVIYSNQLNGNTTESTGIIPYKFYDPNSVTINGTISDNQMDQNRNRTWGITSTGLLTINSCRTYYPDSPNEVTNSYLIIRQVILYKFSRANSLI